VPRKLPKTFYLHDTVSVARALLGCVLWRRLDHGELLAARIVETEAYLGANDMASHARRGLRSARNESMYLEGGHAYVYFTYGMHWCSNVVCGETGWASAVLLRGGAPVEGVDVMRTRRHAARRDRDLASGPARLTQALAITGAQNGADLVRGSVRLLDDGVPPPTRPGRSTRVGLNPGEGDRSRWRWFVRDDPNVSPGRPSGGR
jgi:DNA-3-methyladenine glycosylase